MSAASVLARGRLLAESLMVDTCTVTAAVALTTDDLTGVVTPTLATQYSGRCKVQIAGAGGGSRTEAGAVSAVVLRMELHLPVTTSTTVSHGDLVTITASANDPMLVGRTFVLRDIPPKSFPTAHRFGMEDAT